MAYLFQVLIVICNFHCTKSAIASMIAGMMASHLEFDHQCPSERKGQKRLSPILECSKFKAFLRPLKLYPDLCILMYSRCLENDILSLFSLEFT